MSDNTLQRFQSLGWNTVSVDGYNFTEIDEALTKAKLETKPSLIACQTVIGNGSPNKQNTDEVAVLH